MFYIYIYTKFHLYKNQILLSIFIKFFIRLFDYIFLYDIIFWKFIYFTFIFRFLLYFSIFLLILYAAIPFLEIGNFKLISFLLIEKYTIIDIYDVKVITPRRRDWLIFQLSLASTQSYDNDSMNNPSQFSLRYSQISNHINPSTEAVNFIDSCSNILLKIKINQDFIKIFQFSFKVLFILFISHFFHGFLYTTGNTNDEWFHNNRWYATAWRFVGKNIVLKTEWA